MLKFDQSLCGLVWLSDCERVGVHVQPYISAANNACWALGLLATALMGDAVAPLVPSAAERMLHVLKAAGGSVQRRLRENAAISVGRLATVQPTALAAHLNHFLGDWCVTLATITVRSCSAQHFCPPQAVTSVST